MSEVGKKGCSFQWGHITRESLYLLFCIVSGFNNMILCNVCTIHLDVCFDSKYLYLLISIQYFSTTKIV